MDSPITLDAAPYCPCRAFKQTGKKCAHLWACELLVHNGDYHTAMNHIMTAGAAAEGKADMWDGTKSSKLHNTSVKALVDKVLDSKTPANSDDDAEPDKSLSEDELDERDEVDSEVEDDNELAADAADVADFQRRSTVKG